VGGGRVGGRRSAAGVCCGGRLRAGGLTRRPAAARGCGAAGSLTARGTRGTGHRFSGGTRLGGAAHGAAAAGQQQHCSTDRNRPRSPAVDHGQTIGQFTAPHRKSGLVGVGIRRPVSRVLCSGEFRRRSGGHPSRRTRCRHAPAIHPQTWAGRPRTSAHTRTGRMFLILLRVGFTEPPRSPGVLVVSYTTVSPLPPALARPGGGLFSVALSRGSRRVAVSNHPALWSPDFPRQHHGADAAARSPDPCRSVRRCRRPGFVAGRRQCR